MTDALDLLLEAQEAKKGPINEVSLATWERLLNQHNAFRVARSSRIPLFPDRAVYLITDNFGWLWSPVKDKSGERKLIARC